MAFSFKGISADTYGLKVSVLQPPQRAGSKSETISIPGRPEPLIRNYEEYDTVELTFEAVVTDPSRVRDIFAWLKGSGKLIYDDEPDKYYNALSNQLISITRISDEIRSFQIKFICMPFAQAVLNPTLTFSFDQSDLTGAERTETVNVTVNGSYPSEPLWRIDFAGYLEISVNGSSDKLILDTGETDGEYRPDSTIAGYPGVHVYVPPRKTVYIDTALKIAYMLNGTKKAVCNELTSGIFPMLDIGTNEIFLKLVRKEIQKDEEDYFYMYQNLYSVDITKNERWL